jgi:hypothetical protein
MGHAWLCRALGVSVVMVLVGLPNAVPAGAQDSSAPLVVELVELLDAANAISMAARVPGTSDQFVGALYIQGNRLLVVTGRYAAPELLTTKLKDKAYLDVYVALNIASIPETKVLISDLGANGLNAYRTVNQPFDMAEIHGKHVSFDGDWGRAKLSETEYMSAFASAEEEYVKMLQALVTQMKK